MRLIDIVWARVNAVPYMDLDDALPHPDDPLATLVREDLDRLSVAELEARITSLEGEIARVRQKMEHAVNHRATADQLFKR